MHRFQKIREDQLEYMYRKVEHGIRVLFKAKREGAYTEEYFSYLRDEMIATLRGVYKELGRKPTSKRWPL